MTDKIPQGKPESSEKSLAVAPVVSVMAYFKQHLPMKYPRIERLAGYANGTAWWNRVIREVDELLAKNTSIQEMNVAIDSILPPTDAVFLADVGSVPPFFTQNGVVFIDKISFDSDTLGAEDRQLFWWQPVTHVPTFAALKPLGDFIRNFHKTDCPYKLGSLEPATFRSAQTHTGSSKNLSDENIKPDSSEKEVPQQSS